LTSFIPGNGYTLHLVGVGDNRIGKPRSFVDDGVVFIQTMPTWSRRR
jgi:hypothetical protein